MKLWLVEEGGWDRSYTIVRAETKEAAVRVVHATSDAEVTELVVDGPEGFLWCHTDDGPASD